MSTYEIGVYNQIIRTAIRRGEKVNPLMTISPEFEEVIYFQRVADSKADAIASINREYPLARGYIIDFCVKVSDA